MKKYEIYREEREKGLTYQEIADKYGVSRQNVASACIGTQKRNFRFWSSSTCIYPNVLNWLNENQITCGELIFKMGWRAHSATYSKLYSYLSGVCYPPKLTIDKFLSVTGLSYEQFFATSESKAVIK